MNGALPLPSGEMPSRGRALRVDDCQNYGFVALLAAPHGKGIFHPYRSASIVARFLIVVGAAIAVIESMSKYL